MEIDVKKKISFNGINANGSYLFEPLSSEQLAEVAKGNALERQEDEKAHVAELQFRKSSQDEAHFGVKEGIDAAKLEETGWGVIFPQAKPKTEAAQRIAAIREALSPLLDLRRSQASRNKEHYYREYSGKDGYKAGESKQKYLARLGAGPGPADPDKIPYYLLLVGSPDEIPFRIQYQIDVQYAVGRVYFDTLEEYANYARSVVAAETQGLGLARELACIGVSNPDDQATQLSRANLVAPLADAAELWAKDPDKPRIGNWNVSRYFDDQANKSTVAPLFGGPKTPALMFSASHGMGFDLGDSRQEAHQGALLLQDWTGPKNWKGPIGEELYLSCDDLRSDAGMLGMIAFNFACYGGGTPRYDEFSKQAFKERKAIAKQPFVSGLHRKMLGHPKGGALACLGHVERAWGYSFMWGTGKRGAIEPQLAAFESTLESLMKGNPVGMALEYFNERYAELASDLSVTLEDLDFDPDAVDPYTLAAMWTSNNDARGYAILGDPAVRLRFDDAEGSRERESIDISTVDAGAAAAAPASSAPEGSDSDGDDSDEEASGGPVATEAVDFGLFSRKKKDDDTPDKPSRFEGMINKVAETLGNAVEDFTTLEVRTYVSSNPGAAAAADRETLANEGDLRAFTRIRIDGDMDIIVPQVDGKVDQQLWEMHLEFVKQAQQVRAETMNTVLSALSSLVKL